MSKGMQQGKRSFVRRACVALVSMAVLATAGVQAEDATPTSQTERMATRLVEMMPFGTLLDETAAANPKWPMNDDAGKVTPQQLACMRTELSSEGYLRGKRARAAEYVAANPLRLDDDLALLDRVSPVIGKTVAIGMESAKSGEEVDNAAIMKSMSADDLQAFLLFISDPKYTSLRALSGFGDAFATTRTEEENASAGKSVGERLIAQLMVDALATCDVPTSVLFE